MIIVKSLHTIDVSAGRYTSKDIPEDFNSFISEFVTFATEENKTTKDYVIRTMDTTVIHCIVAMVEKLFEHNWRLDDEEEIHSLADSIAEKLLREEINAQESVANLRVEIKRGSLVQALIVNAIDDIKYVIAKVEHSEWYNSESLQKSFGFPSKSKTVWKSAVLPIVIDDDTISFGSIRVYTDNPAKYWADNFLELEEATSDSKNTEKAFNAIEATLKRDMKKQFPRDYWILRDTVLKEFKTAQQINYEGFISNLLDHYTPEDSRLSVRLDNYRERLLQLPETKKFDRQFNTVPAVIKKRRKLNFQVTPCIEIRINDGEGDLKNDICAFEDPQTGKRFIKIKCLDDETYNTFKT